MGGKRRLAVACAPFVIGLAVATTAAASCDPGRPHINLSNPYKVGWQKDPASGCYNGVIASITKYTPFVWDIAERDTQAFIRLSDGVNTYGDLGWDFYPFTGHQKTMDYAAEDTPNSGGYVETFLNDNFGGDFKITFSSNALHYFENGTSVYTYTNTGYSGCDAREYGSVWAEDNQMMGGYSNNYVQFQHAQVLNSGNWSYFDGTIYNDVTSWYGDLKVSSTENDIWDRACP
jgi:hypothetical protein